MRFHADRTHGGPRLFSPSGSRAHFFLPDAGDRRLAGGRADRRRIPRRTRQLARDFWIVIVLGFACLVSVFLFLKETLLRERRHPLVFLGVLRLYGSLLRDRAFLVHALSGSLAMAGLFAYLEGSPLVFIELNHVSADRFGLFSGIIAAGLIGASQVNGFLVRRAHPGSILRVVLLISAAASIALFATQALQFGGFALLITLLFVCIACLGFVSPNTTALAMAPHGKVAGNASAMLGCMQFAIGGVRRDSGQRPR